MSRNGYSSLWTIHALASVIDRSLTSVYPPVNGLSDKCLGIVNCKFESRVGKENNLMDEIFLMWTSTIGETVESPRIWLPNHFCPLIKNPQVISIEPTQAKIKPEYPSSPVDVLPDIEVNISDVNELTTSSFSKIESKNQIVPILKVYLHIASTSESETSSESDCENLV